MVVRRFLSKLVVGRIYLFIHKLCIHSKNSSNYLNAINGRKD